MSTKQASQVDLSGEILSNEQMYRRDISSQSRFTDERRDALLARAANHDPSARTAILENCLPIVASMARKHIVLTGTHVEYLDLVQIGNLALVESYEQALSKDAPFAYLFGCVRFALFKYCRYHETSITTPKTRGVHPYHFASLDAPLNEESEHSLLDILPDTASDTEGSDPDYTEPLQQAVATLPQRERLIVEHYYGLGEIAPKAFGDINRLLSPEHPQKGNANYYHGRAMIKLRQSITLAWHQTEAGEEKTLEVHSRKRTHKSLPQELWSTVAHAVEQGSSTVKLAQQYGVSADTIRRVVRAVKHNEQCITSNEQCITSDVA